MQHLDLALHGSSTHKVRQRQARSTNGGGKRPIQKNAKNWSTTIQTIDRNMQDHFKLSSLEFRLFVAC
jgi:hypothetical protein